MSATYLIRHAQAGLRHNYDVLSELGRVQARQLGEHLVAERARFAAAYCGSLARQRRTASAVREVFEQAEMEFPEITEDPRWNEFDLGDVYTAVAPELCRDDPKFKQEYERMMEALNDEEHEVHRRHNYCDIAVVNAWVGERYSYGGESWNDFRRRVLSPRNRLAEHGSGAKIAIFTSATPIGVWVAEALELSDRNTWRAAGVTFNSGVTTLQVRRDELRLFTFNGVPHLADPQQRSFR